MKFILVNLLHTIYEYFFDFHPPLGKLIFAGVAKLFAYDGWFSFDKIGTCYTDAAVHFCFMQCIDRWFGLS